MTEFLRLLRDRNGNLPMIVALMLIPMAICSGGALDFVEQERLRVQLQNSLDRGVLAAAAIDQSQDATALVTSYLRTVPAIATASLTVSDNKTAALRRVTGTATLSYKTVFLKLAGIERLAVNATSTAQEARQNIEMSLVLDISGSMVDNGGMAQLKPAAKSFLDVILGADSAKKVTSVNVVPFSGGVNIGKGVFDYLAGSAYVRRHNLSSCFELLPTDFASGTPIWSTHDQFPHFTYYNYNKSDRQPWWCPSESVAVSYMTNDLTALKAKIDALQPYDGTGTAYAMKWAELLLNPSMQNTMKAISNNGLATIPSAFLGRPAAFNDKSTMKFIVLMTDGQIGFQPRPANILTNTVTTKDIQTPASDNRVLYTDTQGSTFYKQVCTYAKAEGITIFTIAFKVTPQVAANIATCATDASYAYKVDGLDMAQAFQSIATTIKKIRITE
jgi:Flp pilus assembly protein TadG